MYPEDRRGKTHHETWHFKKWCQDVSPNLACPMARAVDGQDYFVFEPAVINRGGHPVAVMPIRWFMRDGETFGTARALVSDGEGGYWVDGHSKADEIRLKDLVFSIPKFAKNHAEYNMPNPMKISGEWMK
jgi:hypothetical protein